MVIPVRPRATIASFVVAIVLLACAAGCGKKATIEGTVSDGFGKPLPGVAVSIDKTTFSAASDASGRYAVEYVPGQISIRYAKPGYTSHDATLNISSEARYPAEAVTLWKLPQENGVFLFGDSDYVPLPRVPIAATSESLGSGASRLHFKVSGDFLPVQSKTLRFARRTSVSPCSIIKVAPDGAVGFVEKSVWSGKSEFQEGNPPATGSKQIGASPAVFVDETVLPAGRYAYICFESQAAGNFGLTVTAPSPNEYVYLFEVKK